MQNNCKCIICGAEFRPRKHVCGKYCSRACYRTAQKRGMYIDTHRKKEKKVCTHCGRSFYPVSAKEFCSRDCYDAFRANIIRQRLKPCKVCGSLFDSLKHEAEYCSNECWRIDQQRALLRFCVVCGQMFIPVKVGIKKKAYSITCDQRCAKIYRQQQEQIRRDKISVAFSGAKHPAWLGGRSLHRGESWKRSRMIALRRDQFRCQHCGMTQKEHKRRWGSGLEVHHIVPYRFFDDHLVANRLDNLVSLCVSCHKKAEQEFYRRNPDAKRTQN